VPRILVFSASVGAGHEIPAQAIARAIRARRPDVEVEVGDSLDPLGTLVHRVAEDDMRRTFGIGGSSVLFELEYLLFARTPPLRALGQAALHRVSGRRVEHAVTEARADVVVSTYPAMTEVLGYLRRTGRLRVPAVAVITDLSSLWYWASRGIDLHLLTHPESSAEVERIAGSSTIVAVRGLHDERFLDPPDPSAARAALELPREGPVVCVSGGGWGVGGIERAARIAVGVPGATALALCGYNEPLRTHLRRVLPAVRALPFVDDMPTLLSASDVLVHSTAGLTVLEALLVGCRPISFGWGVAHIRLNNKAFVRTGLARVAHSDEELRRAIEQAVAEPHRPLAPQFARLPHAADEILRLLPER
jgi:processive 1,2-diacylglycerol beta-glucosyltransferase